MKKVVERVQRENETLKKSGALATQDKVSALEQENQNLKVVHHFMFCVVYIYTFIFYLFFCYYNWINIAHLR